MRSLFIDLTTQEGAKRDEKLYFLYTCKSHNDALNSEQMVVLINPDPRENVFRDYSPVSSSLIWSSEDTVSIPSKPLQKQQIMRQLHCSP